MNNGFTKTGLSESDIAVIRSSCSSFSEIDKATLYGSRARGDHKKFSDVDIALLGDFGPTSSAVSGVFGMLEDSNIPYVCDVIHYDSISSEKLKQNIQRDGVLLYTKDTIEDKSLFGRFIILFCYLVAVALIAIGIFIDIDNKTLSLVLGVGFFLLIYFRDTDLAKAITEFFSGYNHT